MLTITPISYRANVNVSPTKVSRRIFTEKPDYFVSFTSNDKSRRICGDIEYEQYEKFTDEQKEELREKYKKFYTLVDTSELFFPRPPSVNTMPLHTDEDMKDFLRVASAYKDYRTNKIVCVGRSPKWFLNAAIWMKDGIENYSLAAFSSNWYHRDNWGLGPKLYRDEAKQPDEQQENAYRKYMKKIKCDPVTLVRIAQKTARPIVITDYIHSGCGLTSYLDLMSRFADDQNVLDDFAKSIILFTMDSEEYIDDLGYTNYYFHPTVILPEKLQPYTKQIPQKYHDMSASVLKSVLIDKNTNECRSTYYPPAAWKVYNPIKYKTGMINEEELKHMPRIKDGKVNHYTDAMRDYRNLMNFRILDYLYNNDLLKEEHKTR